MSALNQMPSSTLGRSDTNSKSCIADLKKVQALGWLRRGRFGFATRGKKQLMLLLALVPCVSLMATSRSLFAQAAKTSRPEIIVVVGAGGEDEFGAEFESWGQRWQDLAERQDWSLTKIGAISTSATSTDAGAESERSAKDEIQLAIESVANTSELWIVLLGHGTFGRGEAKFNLVGPDLAAVELEQWLKPVKGRIVLVNCSSSSAPFLTALSGRQRISVTATRSGSEYNFSRFGNFLAEAVNDPASDIDHDKEVSLLEAFLSASRRVERFYGDASRLATEHALLDDNGDKVGTTADFYRGVLPSKQPVAGQQVDGLTASRIIVLSDPEAPDFTEEQLRQRSQLDTEIDRLRARKSQLEPAEYLDALESVMLRLARLYDEVETAGGSGVGVDSRRR